MNYKETLFFVGKCLTITHEEHNRVIVENKIKYGIVDWDNVVKLSTKHYVFPALYCNLKRADFLHYLPTDLVEYMKHITDLNRERNLQIIEQAKEINELLVANNMTPVFLKGTGNLLRGLYDDIAERMVGDIDFIVDKNTADKTIKVLSENQYTYLNKTPKQLGYIKHYSRMIKKGSINAIEVHLEMTRERHSALFNYKYVQSSIITKKGITYLSLKQHLLHTIINKQLNDYGYQYKNIALRNYYDVFLLSFKTNTLDSILSLPSINKQLNSFLSNASYIFNMPSTILYDKNNHVFKYTTSTMNLLKRTWFTKFRTSFIHFKIVALVRMSILIKALYQRKYFLFVIDKLTDINWCKRRLGIKSTP